MVGYNKGRGIFRLEYGSKLIGYVLSLNIPRIRKTNYRSCKLVSGSRLEITIVLSMKIHDPPPREAFLYDTTETQSLHS